MTDEKYCYKGKNLTTLILAKVSHVVSIIADKDRKTFDECYAAFITSRTYNNLVNTDTLLWSESAEFIVDDYYTEAGANS